ncbi:NUDIX domain-containing protein [Streptomyces sp. NPDC020983]|uniref:NUDIX domain-containing protein n=1 Tax=Streptomyces sp. NPDC020983 TaxID=3365106 RepID=UPI0037AA483A
MTAAPTTAVPPVRHEPAGTAALLVNSRGHYLLHLRDAHKPIWQPGTWALPGGGREPGETPDENIRRELREETGLEIDGLRPFAVVDSGSDGEPTMVYTGRWDGDPAALAVTEGIMLRWTPPAQVPFLTVEPGAAAVIARHQADPEPRPDARGRPQSLHVALPPARHTEPLDVHLILRREGPGGPQVLVTRRAGPVYASGLRHLPSGHLDGPHEDAVAALVREAREETGVLVDPADVRAAVTVHHRSPAGQARIGLFFEVLRWHGTPRIAEPALCDAMEWAPLHALPGDMVAYCRAGLDAYAAGARAAVHFQLPGDPVGYSPGADRLRLLPHPSGHGRANAPERAAHARSRPAVEERPAPGAAGPAHEEGPAAAGPPGWLPPEQYAATLLKATCFACVHLTDEEGRPLQLHAVYSATHPWQLPGGTMEPGERPWETAVRECREETGLTPSGPPRLLATVFGLPGEEWPFASVGLVFDGGRLTAEQIRGITLSPQEHDDVRVLPLAEWEALMPPRDFARLVAVDEARRTGVAAYIGDWDWGDA